MKPTELRMGNYVELLNIDSPVHLPSGIYKKVGQLSFFDCKVYDIEEPFSQQKPFDYSYSALLGIPLTEEWLLKFGFKEDDTDVFVLGFNSHKETLRVYIQGEVWEETAIVIWASEDSISTSGKYVHQLQNLYFALTGEELEIEERFVELEDGSRLRL